MIFASAIILGFITGAILKASRRALRLWWLENVLGPVHNHEEGEPCSCWERAGLRQPTPLKRCDHANDNECVDDGCWGVVSGRVKP